MKTIPCLAVAAALAVGASVSLGQMQIQWADWIDHEVGANGWAWGKMADYYVLYEGDVRVPTQTTLKPGPGENYWIPEDPYLVPNSPSPNPDIITLQQSDPQIKNTISFYLDAAFTMEAWVPDVHMAIVSLGQPGMPVTYSFEQDFNIKKVADGYWNDVTSSTSVLNQSGLNLIGSEGHGTIVFTEAVHQISWSVDPSEYWHGFTVGIPVPEPSAYGLLGVLLLIGLILDRRRKNRGS